MKDGKPTYTYNWVGLERYTVAASEPLAAGKATIKLDFIYDGGGSGKGGTASLSVNGKKVSEGRIGRPTHSSSRPTKVPTSARTTTLRSPRTTWRA